MPESFPEKIRPIWLASYPRSGNTFLRIILERKFDLPTYSLYRVEGQKYRDPSAEALDQAPFLPSDWQRRLSRSAEAAPIIIKTHDLPEDDGPAIYIARDGRAAIDSYFHYHKKFAFEQPSLTEIIAGACQFGSWSGHYFGWRPQVRPQTFFLKYEELVPEPERAVPQLSAFLGIPQRDGRLPAFAELKEKLPEFFRRGNNQDFLSSWTPAQMGLFNQLHGAALRELGYPATLPGEEPSSAATELASSAARLHKLYVQELHSQALCFAAREQLSAQISQLQTQINELSGQLSQAVSNGERLQTQVLAPLLRNRWVRLGLSLRVVPRKLRGNGASTP